MAVAALQNEETTSELTARFGVRPTMIAAWKRALLNGAPDIFDKNQKTKKQTEKQDDKLYQKIGQLQVERDFLSKKLSL